MHDGPIDLIVEAFGDPTEVAVAYRAAAKRFVHVLDELCGELTLLRQPTRADSAMPRGTVARRMMEAVLPHAARHFITPMAAVAGAVAEEILAAMTSSATLARAYVNDGGDIAIHLTAGEQFVVGMVQRPDRPSLFGSTTVDYEHPVRGIATSGWRGRSFSLGIADAVTVLADAGSMADAAATMIANKVELPGNPAIVRERSCDLAPDSDLGERMVTRSVGRLSAEEICEALAAGVCEAEALLQSGLIRSAAINLQGTIRVIGGDAFDPLLTGASPTRRSLIHA